VALKLKLGESEYDLTIHALKPELVLGLNGKRYTLRELGEAAGASLVEIDGKRLASRHARSGNEVHLHHAGRSWTVGFLDPRDAAREAAGGSDEVRAPMPGVVVSIDVPPGQPVRAGQTIVTIESMKLQTSLAAPRDGTVAEVLKAVGETFDKDALVATMEPQEAPNA